MIKLSMINIIMGCVRLYVENERRDILKHGYR